MPRLCAAALMIAASSQRQRASKSRSFADAPILIDPDKMHDFLCTLSLEDSGLFARCLAIGVENGFDKLDDDDFMIRRARITRIKWLAKRDFLKAKLRQTYGDFWFIPDAGRS